MDEVSHDPGFRTPEGRPNARIVAGAIILAISVLVFGYLWWGRLHYYSSALRAISYCGFAAVVLLDHAYFRPTLRGLGFRTDNLRQSFRFALPITGICGLGIVAYAGCAGSLEVHFSASQSLYFPWALLQQYALQNLLLARFRAIVRHLIPAVFSAAVLFALIHSPNIPLVLLTFAGGVVWCWMFSRFPNIFAVSVSHAFLAILLLSFFKFSHLHSLQIGKAGFRYEAYGAGVLVAGGHDELRRPVVVTLPGPNRESQSLLRLYRPSGEFVRQWLLFPEYKFSANIAVGDLGLDPGDEIVAAPGPGPGNPPLIRIFSTQGTKLKEFPLPLNAGYGAWVSVCGGELFAAAGPGPGQSPDIYALDLNGRVLRRFKPSIPGFENGIRALAFRDRIDGAETKRLLLALFGNPISVNPAKVVVDSLENGKPNQTFLAYPTTYGLNLAAVHIGDGRTHLLTAPGPLRGYGPHLKIFDLRGKEITAMMAYDDGAGCGANVGSLDIDADGKDEILMGEGCCRDSKPVVRILDLSGRLLARWDAF